MKLDERDIARLKNMTPQTICHNRRSVLSYINTGLYPAENADFRAEAEAYAVGLRWHWADSFTPPTRAQRFKGAIHICHYCADIPGAPWAQEVQETHRTQEEQAAARDATVLYAERVMKMGGEWGQDDRLIHNPRVAAAYRLSDQVADYEEKYGPIER